MENFVIAILFLSTILLFTVFNSIYICGICDDIIDMIDNGDISAAGELWQENQGYISFFVRDTEIDSVSARAEAIKEGSEAESAQKLRSAVEELRDSEKATFRHIF